LIKLLFKPVSILSGLVAGLLARRSFSLVWRLVDDERPPKSDQRVVSVPKLALALALEGAVFRAVKGLVDHASRQGFADFTGRWPGDEDPGPN
jgi:uncharacterized protein DUF4235